MAKYRYVGSAPAQILDTPYNFARYGQLVEMPEDVAEHAILNRIALIPDAEFSSLGHDEKELKFHGPFTTHAGENPHPNHPNFHLRKAHAWAKLAQLREDLQKKLAPPPAEPEPVAPEESTNA